MYEAILTIKPTINFFTGFALVARLAGLSYPFVLLDLTHIFPTLIGKTPLNSSYNHT